jgi:hypothetical protein
MTTPAMVGIDHIVVLMLKIVPSITCSAPFTTSKAMCHLGAAPSMG